MCRKQNQKPAFVERVLLAAVVFNVVVLKSHLDGRIRLSVIRHLSSTAICDVGCRSWFCPLHCDSLTVQSIQLRVCSPFYVSLSCKRHFTSLCFVLFAEQICLYREETNFIFRIATYKKQRRNTI